MCCFKLVGMFKLVKKYVYIGYGFFELFREWCFVGVEEFELCVVFVKIFCCFFDR